MRSRFDEQLALLNRELIEMGALCEEVIALSAQALTEGNAELAARVAPLDQEIDRKEREIESLCLKLLLQQQPVAKDLRQISAALKMITDMERIGDQAEDIGEIITFLGGRGAENSNLLREMARSTIKMVTESVDAYVKHDTALADQVIAEDDTVDDYFARVKKDLIKRIAQDPDDGEFALDLLMIAKYFERIGDHATNIAEWVIFSVTGTSGRYMGMANNGADVKPNQGVGATNTSTTTNTAENTVGTATPKQNGLAVLGKYVGVSATQTIVEYATFAILHLIGVPSQIANGIAVVCSATYNFVMNRNVTFKSSSNFTRSVALFVLLWIWNFTFSTLLIGWMPGATGLSPYVVKFIAMACQFGWGYPLCKYVIFR